VADGKLVFLRPADGTGRLVFNDDAVSAAPPAEISIDAGFADDMASGTVQLLWDANVSRGERAEVRTRWQSAEPAGGRAATAWQVSQSITVRTAVREQIGQPTAGLADVRWSDSERMGSRTAAVWQTGADQRHALQASWQEADRLRAGMAAAWQDGRAQRLVLDARWDEAVRMRTTAAARWQDAGAMGSRAQHSNRAGLPLRRTLATAWQDARRPPAGLSLVVAPQPPVVEPCYDPETLGRLVFSEPWVAGDGRLVFVCRADDLPPALVVVPVRSWYVAQNSVTLHRVPSGAEFEATRFSLRLDADSWTFGWSASLHRSARPHMTRSTPAERVEVECAVNGVLYRLTVGDIRRDRAFPEDRVSVSGLGRAAELADVDLSFGNTAPRTAQQLMADVLTVNGASLGWTLDWQITDWLVPPAAWLFQGSYIAALRDIAGAVGAYIQPHPTDKVLRVLPRYAQAPWDWATLLTPDIELPADVVSVEGREEVIKPAYNRVFVGGVSKGVFGPVTRAGTAGDMVAPPVTHALITAAEAHRQAGLGVLSDTGFQEHFSLRTMVLPETGIVLPGKVLRYVDEDGPHLGIVRSTQVQMDRWPEMHQTLGVETHVE
jgi:hypothetical protein